MKTDSWFSSLFLIMDIKILIKWSHDNAKATPNESAFSHMYPLPTSCLSFCIKWSLVFPLLLHTWNGKLSPKLSILHKIHTQLEWSNIRNLFQCTCRRKRYKHIGPESILSRVCIDPRSPIYSYWQGKIFLQNTVQGIVTIAIVYFNTLARDYLVTALINYYQGLTKQNTRSRIADAPRHTDFSTGAP